jgi:hypothetical protein
VTARWELSTWDRRWSHFVTNNASDKDILKAFKRAAENDLAVELVRYELPKMHRGAW